jgi:radical SAM-linked protein
MSFASALAVGSIGLREYLDLDLTENVNISAFGEALREALPTALSFVAAKEIDPTAKSLSAMINLAVYRIKAEPFFEKAESFIEKIYENGQDARRARFGVAGILTADELWRKPRQKPGKKMTQAKEVRSLIRRIELIEVSRAITLEVELIMAAQGHLRPDELWSMIADLGELERPYSLTVDRLALLVLRGEKAFSPMDV